MASRARITRTGAVGLALVVGCGFDAIGNNRPPAPGLGDAAQTTGPAGKPDDADDADESAGLSESGSGGQDPETGDDAGSGDPTMGSASTTGDPTDTADETSGATGDDMDSTGEDAEPPPTEAFLANVNLGQCGSSLGCWSGNTPAGPFLAVECFDSPVPPPYEVRYVHLDVSWRSNQFDDLQVQVLERQASGTPGDVIWSGWMINRPDFGVNEIVFTGGNPEPSTSGFCVGFYIPDGGMDGGIEFSTAFDSNATSWYGSCGASSWTELNTQNWCMGAFVEAP